MIAAFAMILVSVICIFADMWCPVKAKSQPLTARS